jgi:hypothetical protein
MMQVDKVHVDLETARSQLVRMLLGSYIDSFNVSSIQILLRLINTNAQPGFSLYVDLSFSCQASLLDEDEIEASSLGSDFFAGRSRFLGDIYSCIGKEISGIEVGSDGRLRLIMDDWIMQLSISDEDMESDAPIWQVAMEGAVAPNSSSSVVVSCVSTGSEVVFIFSSKLRMGSG